VLAQSVPLIAQPASTEPLLPRALDVNLWGMSDAERASADRPRPLPLFHMPTGFLSQPVGAELDSDSSSPGPGELPPADADTLDLPFQAALFADIPFFDFQRPGDVGGLGFYRIHTQLQVLETEKAGCALGLQAVTPAGLEVDGLADGPTVFSPSVAWFHEVGEGGAVQAYFGKSLRLNSRWGETLGRSLHCGMGISHPVPGFDGSPLPRIQVFVEALGRYRFEGEPGARGPAAWELLPGLHWQLADGCWLSGGVLVPVNASRYDAGLWQVTASWRF
jgi:hypothetical protein